MKKFLINIEETNEQDFYNTLENVINEYVSEHIDELIDECYSEIKIGYMTFSPSEILQECSPAYYQCFISDEQDHQYKEAIFELERYGLVEIDGMDFEIIDQDEDEE